MLVKIRLPRGIEVGRNKRRIAPLTFIAAGLLRMAAVLCLMLALWRLTNDLGWTGAFVVDEGFFSHWQVWLALTLGISILSFRLLRYSRRAEPAALPVEALATPEPEPRKPELARRGAAR